MGEENKARKQRKRKVAVQGVALHQVSATAPGVGDAHDIRFHWTAIDKKWREKRRTSAGPALHPVSAAALSVGGAHDVSLSVLE